ncbi:MAG: Non-canonical purine NTP pyrophosphatase [Candidatus Heimdallarchaeota archaeon LC_3]|nr:MAG: Non-canonical purine NTP pyrophosphatase [Candidatus Heimdallarchaeota archaeon LC_3]
MNEIKEITFGTSNIHKTKEATAILEDYGFKVKQDHVDLFEIQDNNLEIIAKTSLLQLPDKLNYFVEDTGLFISSLNGFPGPYAAYVSKTIFNEGILKLMKNVSDRKAFFKSVIAYRDNNNKIHLFKGKAYGTIAWKIRTGNLKPEDVFGYDPIFIPDYEINSNLLTFSEMDFQKKNMISHRAQALNELGKFIKM